MSLNWNLTKCANLESIKSEPEWPVTEALIWATMVVGLGSITESNWTEFYTRLSAYELINGSFLRNQDGEPVYISPEMVRARIGLSCNVPDESKAKFKTKLEGWVRERATSALSESVKADAAD